MEGLALMRRSNLPSELSSFVGRRHELQQVRSALSEHRLVTLFGPGGVGKTRLAFRVAADLAKAYQDGAWVVELAPVHDSDLVVETVIAALGLRDHSGVSPLQQLVGYLADREVLLVLDNCEHVQHAASLLIGRLLDDCPRVRIIATSRHSFAVPGEHLLSIPPMPVPAADRGVASAEGLMHYDAVRLFVDRATASWASFEVNAGNQAALAELLRRLDGVPLAIELASVRVRSLSVQQILDRLADRFALLTRGSRAALPRQQTLRALIDWSYELLSPAERLLWARATVFSGSFDVESVRAVVCDDEVAPAEAGSLLDALAAKSILVRDGVGPAARYRMLESIREYGVAQLDASGTTERFTECHRLHFTQVAATAAREMYGAAGVTWFRRLRADHDNFRAALDACVRSLDHVQDGLMTVGHLQHYWVMVGRFAEGRLWADRLLERSDERSVPRAAALEVAGRLAVLQGDVDEGRPLLDEALEAAANEGSDTWRAQALHGQALAAMFWGDPADAVPLLEEALVLHEGGEDSFGIPLALVQLATVHATLDEPERALAYAERCIEASEALGEQWCAALARWTQALIVWRAGRRAKAKTYARDVLRLKQPFGDRLGMAMSIEMLAWAAADEGRFDHAAVLLGAVDAALASIGSSLFRHLLDDHEACVAGTSQALGDMDYARHFREGQDLTFDEAVQLALGRRRGEGTPEGEGAAPAVKLTRRETEIAGLVADDLTNREIAERLFMSQRTAEGHVARILRKLGFTTREQIKAWMAEHHRHV